MPTDEQRIREVEFTHHQNHDGSLEALIARKTC